MAGLGGELDDASAHRADAQDTEGPDAVRVSALVH
jgi:hypothetical protein